ncbi:MAG: hypothetical protein JJ992_00275 [Planctomycetes bacterium]|nr:hypothetical protein [Planctomycetota bacterium]
MTIIKPIIAGMPALLPWENHLQEVQTEPYARQIQLLWISAIVLLVGALFIKLLWNSLASGIEKLPQLTYLRSLGLTVLWGLAMVVVLILIDGTRHTLSPSAWVREGWTYRLAGPMEEARNEYRRKRKDHLKQLQRALESYTRIHDGSLPENLSDLGGDLSLVPEAAGLQYVYHPGDDSKYVVLEPEIDTVRYSLTSDGEVVEWSGK